MRGTPPAALTVQEEQFLTVYLETFDGAAAVRAAGFAAWRSNHARVAWSLLHAPHIRAELVRRLRARLFPPAAAEAAP